MNTTSDLKRSNVSAILHTIQRNSAISKNRIAEQLHLSPVTVHKLVNELVARGICVPDGSRVSTGGRNAALYRINGAYGYIIGQTLTRRTMTTTVCDLSLKLLYAKSVEIDLHDQQKTLRDICEQLNAARLEFPGANFLGAGIAMPGCCNSQGVVLQIPDVETWKFVPLQTIVESAAGLAVSVDNDNNALAISARWNGLTKGYSDFVYMQITEGIGTGIMLNDKLFRGSFGYGCEIGHTSISLSGKLCGCGNRGCLETFISSPSLLESANSFVKKPFTRIDELIEYTLETRDPKLYGVFKTASSYVAITIKHMIRIFDPKAVILRCEWLAAFPELFEDVRESVYSDFPWLRRDMFSIILDDDELISALSAACLFAEGFYASGGVSAV